MTRELSKLSEQFRCVALSELPLEQAADAQHKALSRFGPVHIQPLGSWHDAFSRLQPLRTFPRRYLVAGLGNWSLVLCDMIGECCLVDVLFHSRLTGCRAVGGIALPSERRFFYLEGGKKCRNIECIHEDRWYFREEGVAIASEHPEYYIRRSRSERLPEHLVFDYISAITGITFPLDFGSMPPRLVAFERSWHQIQQTPEELNVTNDLEASSGSQLAYLADENQRFRAKPTSTPVLNGSRR